MLTIRFFRTGKKHQPFFKIVVIDKRRPPKAGRFVEEVGFYNPLTKEKNLKAQRVKYWLTKGAQPSGRVHNLLVSEKILTGKKIALHKKAKKKEEKKEKPTEEKLKEEKPAEKEPEKKEETPKEEKSEEKLS